MPRLQIDATQLKNTDVNFVSLVKHGANRIPFRIMKGETEAMLDLGKIGLSMFKKADAPQGVVAVLVSKSADLAKLQPAMEKAGLVFSQKSETEGGLVFAQPDVPAGSRDGILRISEDVALAVSGLAEMPSRVQKDFCSYDGTSTSFMSVMNTEGFYPSMSMATSALMDTIMNIMDSAASPSEAEGMVSAAIDDFKGYILPTISGIPVRAFKADVAVRKATDVVIVGVGGTAAEDMHKKQPGNQETVSAAGTGDGPGGVAYNTAADAARAVKAEGPIGVGVGKEASPVFNNQGRGDATATPGGEAPIGVDAKKEPGGIEATQEGNRPINVGSGKIMNMTGDGPIGTDANPESSPVFDNQGRGDITVAGLMKGLEDALAASIGTFRTEVLSGLTSVQKDVGGLAKRIDGVEARTVKAEEAISGTALGDAPGDTETRQRTQKSEGAPPLLDTAYGRRAA